MLDSLLLEPGHRVLELGTGSGWNAALVSWRAGPGRVVSMEVDAALAGQARQRLDAVGAGVSVVMGDGTASSSAGSLYDRLISTFAVERIPWSWVSRTRPGGRLVTPWGRLGHVALTVADDGRSATGWVQGLAQFMPARGSDPGWGFRQVRGDEPAQGERPFSRDIRPISDDAHLRFALRVLLPEVRIATVTAEDGPTVWLHDGETSWATLSTVDGTHPTVCQGGPRRLAEEVEMAWDYWLSDGSPDLYDFGLTVEQDRQFVWVRDPAAGPWPPVRSGVLRTGGS
jgi:protein-L-isoaspartate O-methyltransferase